MRQITICIIITAPSRPYPVTDVTVMPGQKTALINFTVSSFSYTIPETYRIIYYGLNAQEEYLNSNEINSTAKANTSYQFTLTGLEDYTTYNFSVISTNCIGSTSTDLKSFTTLPACKLPKQEMAKKL